MNRRSLRGTMRTSQRSSTRLPRLRRCVGRSWDRRTNRPYAASGGARARHDPAYKQDRSDEKASRSSDETESQTAGNTGNSRAGEPPLLCPCREAPPRRSPFRLSRLLATGSVRRSSREASPDCPGRANSARSPGAVISAMTSKARRATRDRIVARYHADLAASKQQPLPRRAVTPHTMRWTSKSGRHVADCGRLRRQPALQFCRRAPCFPDRICCPLFIS